MRKIILIFERRITMNLVIVTFIFTALLYSPIQAICKNNQIYFYEFRHFYLACGYNNPCELNAYYAPERGYQCIQKDATTVLCTCPGGIEENMPCRMMII